MTKYFLKIYPKGPDNFNTIINFLNNKNLECHSYCPPCAQPFRIVIRNLHHTTLTDDISDAELGHSVQYITNITKNKIPLPLFAMSLRTNTNNKIFDISNLLHTTVSIEKPFKVNHGLLQCHKCQSFGHTKNYCKYKPRCVKCGENHSSLECTKDRLLPAKYALCSRPHTSSYKGCPIFKKMDSITHKSTTTKRIPPILSTRVSSMQSHSHKRTYTDITANQFPAILSNSQIIAKFLDEFKAIINHF